MIGPITAAGLPPAPDPAAKARDAAGQFEALLIAQMLKSAQGPDGSGWLGTGEDQAGMQAMELAQEFFAGALAKGGGLGLAKPVLAGLEAAQNRQR